MDYKLILVVICLVAIVGIVGILIGSEGITGGAVANTVACYDSSDCNDGIAATEDICRNPGTINSLCVNKPL